MVNDGRQVGERVDQQPLPEGDVRELISSRLIFGPQLQHLLVQRRRFWKPAPLPQILRDTRELFDRLVEPFRLNIQVAEPVGGGPVIRSLLKHLRVDLDGVVDLALSQQSVGVIQCLFNRHRTTFVSDVSFAVPR